jgi:adenylosuccinate synthase
MPAWAVIGGQWGDEGKGKIVDFLAQDADIVVRFAGGGNAGHSVENESGKFALRTIPVGMVNSHTRLNIIGRGAVPELGIVVKELMALEDRGMDITRLRVDEAAHLVMPWHIAQDRLEEEKKRKNNNSIGTTGNGIGPCYADKIRRVGFRAGDLIDIRFWKRYQETFRERAAYLRRNYRAHFTRCDSCDICGAIRSESDAFLDLDYNLDYLLERFHGFGLAIMSDSTDIAFGLNGLICDTRQILWDALDRGQKILLEGAQGFMLDIDHGTYPYVTSSCTGVASAAQGSGVPIHEITERIAVIKAYPTRVGGGPFPTEMPQYPARRIRELGHEYGTVTGRPRRIGWFDTVYFKEMARANGITGLAITRLDIVDDFPLIGIGVDDGRGGRRIEWMPGWRTWVLGQNGGGFSGKSVRECRTWDSLPEAAKDYCKRIACGYPIKYISVGPSREETIVL